MKSRLNAVVLLIGLALALSSLSGVPFTTPALAQGCPPNVVHGCNLTGSNPGGNGWQVRNTSSTNNSVAILGYASASSGVTYGLNAQSNSPSGYGSYVVAAATTGTNYGLYAVSNSPSGYGIYGVNTATSGSYDLSTGKGSGIVGQSTVGPGLYAKSTTITPAIVAYNSSQSGQSFGIFGYAFGNPSAVGVNGYAQGIGILGETISGTGVEAVASSNSGTNYGLYARTNSPSGYAGYFEGRVHVQGTLSKSAGSFKIDHPLDPANKYLAHSFVESPDMMNIYNGNVVLDKKGEAVVTLPDYFEALNAEFRYQLTSIGAPGPNLYIAEEIKGNQFTIAGGEPGAKVSWQITGVRQDPYAKENPIVVEADKPVGERGRYLYPRGYGQPATRGVGYRDPTTLPNTAQPAPPSQE